MSAYSFGLPPGGGGGGDVSQAELDAVADAALAKAANLSDLEDAAEAKSNLSLAKADVGLGNADNTSDANKPVSSAAQTALDLKAPLASPTFTGTVAGVTKGHVGLGNVDNTADTAKPVSTAQQTALNLKAPLASPTFTGTVAGVTKGMVGLGSVDNTADTAKPVSTAQQTALDLKAVKAHLPFNVRNYGAVGDGTTDDTAALHAAYAAATAVKGTVFFPPGVYVVTGTFALSGYSCSTVGSGAHFASGAAAGTVIKAVSQTGPVLDFAGFTLPDSMRGRLTVLADVAVAGDGTADATLVKSGIRVTAMSSALFRDIVVTNTGGPCLDLTPTVSGNACYFVDFERITLVTPVSAEANDVPYLRAAEPNGNRFRGIGIRSLSASNDVGASGAVVITDGASFTGHDNLFDGWWYEFLHPPTGGTLFHLQGNANIIRDFQFFDVSKEAGASGTSHFRLEASAVQDLGGNLIQGVIPGRGTDATAIDTGVQIGQSRNAVVGVKGFRGYNVTLDSGAANCTVQLMGGVSGVIDPGWVDNSGVNSNRLVDNYLQAEIKPLGFGDRPTLLDAGETVWDRRDVIAPVGAMTSGLLQLVYFTAQRSETIASVKMLSAQTAAAATPTLVRFGIYEVAANGDLTLVASTANDTAIFAGTHTAYDKALSVAWGKVAGRRYAVAVLVVSGAAMPVLYGSMPVGAAAVLDTLLSAAPRWTGQVAGQTDLPASVAAASVAATRRCHYAELLT